ncbi:MAG: metalloregulator ArsR/SmtB family transcription factor [Actinomycetales bacterium]|nr:metalloregulator ArsR/SmtB family transcription factor [Actinomycetales bacterium]
MSSVLVPPPRVPAASVTAAQFALLADPLRLAIIEALAREQLCTCHLIDITGAQQTTISNHLRLLRQAGVVATDRQGRYTWYSLAPGAFASALLTLAGVVEDGPDARRLRPACAS